MSALIFSKLVSLRQFPLQWIIPVLLLACIPPATPLAGQHNNGAVIQPVLKKGVLLIASRHLVDPYFGQAVIVLTKYDRDGSSGIIINRRTELPVSSTFPEIVKRLPILENLYIGGPVASSRVSLLVQSSQNIDGANEILKDIYHIDTQVLFQGMDFSSLAAANTRLYSGFAGWAPGQLEAEMQRGDWHIWQADAAIIFSQAPDELWGDLIDLASAKWVFAVKNP